MESGVRVFALFDFGMYIIYIASYIYIYYTNITAAIRVRCASSLT